MGLSLLEYLDSPWEKARGYLREDLDSIVAAFNQRWAATFGDGNELPLTTGVTGVLPTANGGTGFAAYTTGDLLYAPGPTALGKLPVGAAGTVLVGGSLPAYSATPTLTSVTAPLLVGGSGVNAILVLKATTGIGVADEIQLKVGNNGSVTALRVLNSGYMLFADGIAVSTLINIGAVSGSGDRLYIEDASGGGIRLRRTATGAGSGTVGYIDFANTTRLAELAVVEDGAVDAGFMAFWTKTTGLSLAEHMRLDSVGRLGIGQTTITAFLHLKAGTATAGTAPFKLASGTILTAAEPGVHEYNGNHYLSNSTIRFPLGGTLFDHYVNAGNVSTGETDLYADTLAASTLAANGDKIEATYGGAFVASGTATREIKVYFAGTVIFDTGALSIAAGSDAWEIFVTIIRETSAVVRCSVTMTTTGATLNAYATYTRITGLTLSSTTILKLTGQAAGVGAASDDIVASLGTVGFSPAA